MIRSTGTEILLIPKLIINSHTNTQKLKLDRISSDRGIPCGGYSDDCLHKMSSILYVFDGRNVHIFKEMEGARLPDGRPSVWYMSRLDTPISEPFKTKIRDPYRGPYENFPAVVAKIVLDERNIPKLNLETPRYACGYSRFFELQNGYSGTLLYVWARSIIEILPDDIEFYAKLTNARMCGEKDVRNLIAAQKDSHKLRLGEDVDFRGYDGGVSFQSSYPVVPLSFHSAVISKLRELYSGPRADLAQKAMIDASSDEIMESTKKLNIWVCLAMRLVIPNYEIFYSGSIARGLEQ